MSVVEPTPPEIRTGHPVGDVHTEELVGHGHFVTHFDRPSIDFSATGTKITEETRQELRQIAARYPQARSALLPMLHLVQSVEGRVTPAGIETCAEILDLSTADVSGVATFYTMYKRHPVGEYHVGVCTTALCAIMGGDDVYAALQDHLEIGNDETTADGKITLEHVECNAACDFAPVMMVNWEFFDNTTPQRAIEVVDALRAGEQVTATRGARVCTWKQAERVLAGFPDDRADEGPTAAGPSLLGLKIATQNGWSAPAVPEHRRQPAKDGAPEGGRDAVKPAPAGGGPAPKPVEAPQDGGDTAKPKQAPEPERDADKPGTAPQRRRRTTKQEGPK
jgi:NADH-quinone oxidoreductase subunit E